MVDNFVQAQECGQKALACAKALEYEPLSALCHFNIGKALSKQKKHDDAVESFKRAEPAVGSYVRRDEWDKRLSRAEIGERRMNHSEVNYSVVSELSAPSIGSQDTPVHGSIAR